MKIVNYSYARKNFRSVIDECVKTNIPVCIVSKSNQVVIIPKEDYDKMIGILNLLNKDK